MTANVKERGAGKEFLTELKRFKINQKNCEKEWLNSIQISNKRMFHKDLLETEEMLNKEYLTELHKIEKNLRKIRQNVQQFKVELSKDSVSQRVNKIQALMETTESLITGLKEEQQEVFREIIRNEKTCESEIDLINTRIEALQAPSTKSTKKNVKSISSLKNTETLPAAVIAFQRFVDSNGSTGGWDDSDHATFLKLLKKYKGPPDQLHEYIHNSMPFRNSSDISKHVAWHKRFSDLKHDKNRAIANWKLEKDENTRQNSVPKEPESVPVASVVDQASLVERELKRKQIEKWKKAKLQEEEIKNEQKLKEQEHKRKMEAKRFAEQQKHNEDILQRLKQKREMEQREQWTREMEEQWVLEGRRKQALQDVKKFQARDQIAIKHKLRMKKLKEKEEAIRKEKLEKTKEKVYVAPDRNRLYEFTEAWIERKNASPDSNVSVNVNKIPHRAVPGWRQPL